jgi:toxin ParE1/3/4
MGHRLSPQARNDVDDIAYYVAIESGSLETADRFLQSIYERFLLLGAHPYAGRSRDDILPGLRLFPSGQYVVLYRVEGDDVVIQRVVRGSRNLEALFRGAENQKHEDGR